MSNEQKQRYRCEFSAKRRGAIGISSRWIEVVDAKDRGAARLQLYEKYDHIHLLKIHKDN